MTPEQDLGRIVRALCPDCGHWPYERDSDLYVGWRPGREDFFFSSDRIARVKVTYDLVIAYGRGSIERAEALRYALCDALQRGGWGFADAPGPETYIATHDQRLWPISIIKGFILRDGVITTVKEG